MDKVDLDPAKKTKAGACSSGMKQKLGIAQVRKFIYATDLSGQREKEGQK